MRPSTFLFSLLSLTAANPPAAPYHGEPHSSLARSLWLDRRNRNWGVMIYLASPSAPSALPPLTHRLDRSAIIVADKEEEDDWSDWVGGDPPITLNPPDKMYPHHIGPVGSLKYMIEDPVEVELEEWERYTNALIDNMWIVLKKSEPNRAASEKLWQTFKFQWAWMDYGEGIEEAKRHFRNLLKTGTLPDHLSDDIFFFVDAAARDSVLVTPRKSPPYLIAVDPHFEAGDATCEGYDGTVKAHVSSFLTEFWYNHWTKGLGMRMEDLFMTAVESRGGVYNGEHS